MLWYGGSDRISGVLSWRPLVYIGRVSYGIYLYQMAVHMLVWGPLLGGITNWPKWPKFGVRAGAFVLLSIGVASLSYAVIERPFLRLKNRFR